MKANEGSTFRSVKSSLNFPSLAVLLKDFLHFCNETRSLLSFVTSRDVSVSVLHTDASVKVIAKWKCSTVA
jgi:hypothetical protein